MSCQKFGYFVLFFHLLQFVAANDSVNGTDFDTRIVGGVVTSIKNVPYIMKIRLDRRFICGGSLVAPKYVVSAAHCFQNVAPNRLLVIGGATELTETGVQREVQKIMMPENFVMATMVNDVAVLKLTQPMIGTNIQTISLYDGALNPGTPVRVSGWGRMIENGKRVSIKLRTVVVPVIPHLLCEIKYRGHAVVTQGMFCASIPGFQDACTGDSGGPAVCNGKLCGIVSWGIGCARLKFPGIYTNINSVRQFITNCLQL